MDVDSPTTVHVDIISGHYRVRGRVEKDGYVIVLLKRNGVARDNDALRVVCNDRLNVV